MPGDLLPVGGRGDVAGRPAIGDRGSGIARRSSGSSPPQQARGEKLFTPDPAVGLRKARAIRMASETCHPHASHPRGEISADLEDLQSSVPIRVFCVHLRTKCSFQVHRCVKFGIGDEALKGLVQGLDGLGEGAIGGLGTAIPGCEAPASRKPSCGREREDPIGYLAPAQQPRRSPLPFREAGASKTRVTKLELRYQAVHPGKSISTTDSAD